MFIQTESTPNPATLKFLPGCTVLATGTANFVDESESGKSPLAEALFAVPGVTGVFFGADFITATKSEDKEWDLMKPMILGAIMDHFTQGKPVMTDDGDAGTGNAETEDPISLQIIELLDTRVRPAVAQDGGDIVFHGFDDGVVYLRMQGACAGCPSSTATLKHGIENMLRYYIPEVAEVRAVE